MGMKLRFEGKTMFQRRTYACGYQNFRHFSYFTLLPIARTNLGEQHAFFVFFSEDLSIRMRAQFEEGIQQELFWH